MVVVDLQPLSVRATLLACVGSNIIFAVAPRPRPVLGFATFAYATFPITAIFQPMEILPRLEISALVTESTLLSDILFKKIPRHFIQCEYSYCGSSHASKRSINIRLLLLLAHWIVRKL